MNQGLTEPYLCKGDDQQNYVVKGSNATPAGLVKEWIVAHLGKEFGLPIPPFKIAWLDDALVQYNSFDIEAGYCFASEYQSRIQEITFNQIESLDKALLKDLFMFDYWIKNNDRNLTQYGGNANFFFDQKTKKPYVLDHNLSFASDFNLDAHINQHVGSYCWEGLDLVDREHYEKKFEKSLAVVDNAVNSLPEDWVDRYPEERIEQDIRSVLHEFRNDKFWEGIKK